MSGENISVETIRRIYDNDDGVYIEIGPNADFGEVIEIRVTEEKSVEFYGAVRLNLTKSQARALAGCLQQAAKEAT